MTLDEFFKAYKKIKNKNTNKDLLKNFGVLRFYNKCLECPLTLVANNVFPNKLYNIWDFQRAADDLKLPAGYGGKIMSAADYDIYENENNEEVKNIRERLLKDAS